VKRSELLASTTTPDGMRMTLTQHAGDYYIDVEGRALMSTRAPGSEKDLAGIVCLQNEGSNYVFGVTKKGKDDYLLLKKNKWPGRSGDIISEVLASTKIDISNPIHLKVTANGDDYQFLYSTNAADFVNLGGTVSGDILSTNVAGGFTEALLGLYATSGNDILPE